MYYGYGSKYKARSFETHSYNKHNTINIDKQLLKDLLTIQAPSEYEEDMRKFIMAWVKDNVPDARITADNYGNIYITKGFSHTFPCVVAHMDEVNDFQTDRYIIELGNLFVGLNRRTGQFAGCPGDDRVGCYTALELLRVLPNIKVAFFVEEEIGGKGSYASNLNFFKNCAFILQADRNGNNEVITSTNGATVASKDFIKAITPYMEKYHYELGAGTFTDVGVLSTRGVGISCLNLGCGYFDAHSEEEKVCIPDVENVLNMMYFFCLYLADRKWKHKAEYLVKKYTPATTMTSSSYSSFNLSKGGSTSPGTFNATKTKDTTKVDVDFEFTPDDTLPCMTCRDFDCMNCDKVDN